MSVNAANSLERPYVKVNADHYDLEGFELLGRDEAQQAVEEGIGAQVAYNANRAETYARTVFINGLTFATCCALNAVTPSKGFFAAAAEGVLADRFSETVTNSRVGRGMTWMTGKLLSNTAACVSAAYLTALVAKGPAAPSPLRIAYATWINATRAAAPAA